METIGKIKKGIVTNYVKPEDFRLLCGRCYSDDVFVTIVDFNKIEFICENCGREEKV